MPVQVTLGLAHLLPPSRLPFQPHSVTHSHIYWVLTGLRAKAQCGGQEGDLQGTTPALWTSRVGALSPQPIPPGAQHMAPLQIKSSEDKSLLESQPLLLRTLSALFNSGSTLRSRSAAWCSRKGVKAPLPLPKPATARQGRRSLSLQSVRGGENHAALVQRCLFSPVKRVAGVRQFTWQVVCTLLSRSQMVSACLKKLKVKKEEHKEEFISTSPLPPPHTHPGIRTGTNTHACIIRIELHQAPETSQLLGPADVRAQHPAEAEGAGLCGVGWQRILRCSSCPINHCFPLELQLAKGAQKSSLNHQT